MFEACFEGGNTSRGLLLLGEEVCGERDSLEDRVGWGDVVDFESLDCFQNVGRKKCE